MITRPRTLKELAREIEFALRLPFTGWEPDAAIGIILPLLRRHAQLKPKKALPKRWKSIKSAAHLRKMREKKARTK